MKRPLAWLTTVFLLLGAAGLARADLVYENIGGPFSPSSWPIWISDDGAGYGASSGWRVYDDFALTGAAVVRSAVFSLYTDNAGQFEFSISTSQNNRPDAVVFEQTLDSIDYGISYIDHSPDGRTESVLSFNLASAVSLAPGDYFISLYGIDGSVAGYPMTHYYDPTGFALQVDQADGTVYERVLETSFALHDALIPEPATFSLLLLGGLMIRRVR